MLRFTLQRPARGLGLGLVLISFAVAASASPVTTISSGYTVPEDVVAVPTGFGSVGGDYFVTDAGSGNVYTMGPSGGTPSVFASLSSVLDPIGGVFLPTGYGSLSGDFLAVGLGTQDGGKGDAVAVNSSGSVTRVASGVGNLEFADTIVAPAGFGSASGKVLIASESGEIYQLNTDGTLSLFASLPSITPFGMAFSNGKLLVTDTFSGDIYSVDSSGATQLFTTVPLGAGQTGLRQIERSPACPGCLYLSVSGSQFGGGVGGSVDELNALGQVSALLPQYSVGSGFDPRGLYSPNSSELFIANTDPGILLAQTSAFQAVPEPSLTLLTALFGIALAGVYRRKRNQGGACES